MPKQPFTPEQDGTQSPRSGTSLVFASLAVIALGIVGYLLVGDGAGRDGSARSVDGEPMLMTTPEPGAEQTPTSPRLTVEGPLEGVLPVRHGDVLHLELAQVEAAGGLRFEFTLPAPQSRDAKHPVRIYAAHLAPVELDVIEFDADLTKARIDVPPGTISEPGQYIVEIRTNEKSPFPLRRFAVEVR